MKKGLILEGGAMRGMFTAGVIDVLMEEGIEFDGAIGVSAGAAFGCNYKSRQIGRVLRYNVRFCKDKRYSGLYSLRKDGNIYSASFAYGLVPLKYDPFDFETYEANPMEFYVVCVDVETGEPVYHKYLGWDDHGFDWIRASASMPLVSEIVEINGQKLLDGGMADSVPIQYFESIGYDRNVIVLTQPYNYVKKKNKLVRVMRRKYRKYPKMVDTVARRHIVYNETLSYIKGKEACGEVLVIRPDAPLEIGKLCKDPKKIREVYELGREVATREMEKIKAFLKQE